MILYVLEELSKIEFSMVKLEHKRNVTSGNIVYRYKIEDKT